MINQIKLLLKLRISFQQIIENLIICNQFLILFPILHKQNSRERNYINQKTKLDVNPTASNELFRKALKTSQNTTAVHKCVQFLAHKYNALATFKFRHRLLYIDIWYCLWRDRIKMWYIVQHAAFASNFHIWKGYRVCGARCGGIGSCKGLGINNVSCSFNSFDTNKR